MKQYIFGSIIAFAAVSIPIINCADQEIKLSDEDAQNSLNAFALARMQSYVPNDDALIEEKKTNSSENDVSNTIVQLLSNESVSPEDTTISDLLLEEKKDPHTPELGTGHSEQKAPEDIFDNATSAAVVTDYAGEDNDHLAAANFGVGAADDDSSENEGSVANNVNGAANATNAADEEVDN